MPGVWVELMRPLAPFLPTIERPAKDLRLKDRCVYVMGVLVFYLIASKVPLYGPRLSSETNDPLGVYRVMLASNRGTLMELGISPVVSASMILQVISGMKLVTVNRNDPQERAMYEVLEKCAGIFATLGQAFFYTVVSGMYGSVWSLGVGNVIIILAQLCASGIMVILWDDLLQKGYGFGSAISLFISCNICENIMWNAFSYNVVKGVNGPQYEGAMIHLMYQLASNTGLSGLKDAFFRSGWPNITSLLATVVVFCIVIYFQGFRVDIPIKHTKIRAGSVSNTYPIRLFYTSNMPIMIQSTVTSSLFLVSNLLQSRFGTNPLTWILGTWHRTPYGKSIPVSGFCYYISPPQGLSEVFRDPLHFTFYVLYMLFSCAFFASQWLEVSGSGSKDVARNLKEQGMTVIGYRPDSMYIALNRYIPPAAVLGGFCVGALTIFSDFMGALGSGTSILLAVGNILQVIEQAQKQAEKEAAEGIGGLTGMANLFR